MKMGLRERLKSALKENRGLLTASGIFLAANYADAASTSLALSGLENFVNNSELLSLENNPIIRTSIDYLGISNGVLTPKILGASLVIVMAKKLDGMKKDISRYYLHAGSLANIYLAASNTLAYLILW